MQRSNRRLGATWIGVAGALLLSMPKASADILPEGDVKWLDKRFMVLHVERFDPYCEHRHTIAKGDTFEAIAKSAYGDAKRAKEIAAANPKLQAEHLPVGGSIRLPPKELPPKDATETLAWEFWAYCNLSGTMPLQRVFPGETFEVEGKYPKLVAVPAAHHDKFEKLVDVVRSSKPGPDFVMPETILEKAPWAIVATQFHIPNSVLCSTGAVECTASFKIVELVATTDVHGRFVVEATGVVYRDRTGNVVKAGFELLFSWRGLPLGLIALIGWFGLRRMRRARGGAAAS